MFAIAAWNERLRRLRLIRDRAGEKPLFYSRFGDEVWFASEIQALRIHPEFDSRLDESAINDYVAFGYVREPKTLHAHIKKVCAGTILEIGQKDKQSRPLDTEVDREPNHPFKQQVRLKSLLELAVTKQMHADVPVGVFLSGGLDSSLVTAFATRAQPGISSFTVRFPEASYDEGLLAREVAAHFGTRHHEVMASGERLTNALEIATSRIAEPIADPATLPTILLSKTAREHVGVVLSGEGSDEQFGGYPTYLGHSWAALFERLPTKANRMIRALHNSASSLWGAGSNRHVVREVPRTLRGRRCHQARQLVWHRVVQIPIRKNST